MMCYSVHLMVQEKIVVTAGRDGGLQNMEVLGTLQLKISDPQYDCILVAIGNQDNQSLQLQLNKSLNDNIVTMEICPNVAKKLFTTDSTIGLKQASRSFPINSDIGVLKWRLQTVDEALLPLSSELLW